jgi:F420-dependent oxidoreductase-like protein
VRQPAAPRPGVARRLDRGVRRALVPRAREQLGEQEGEHDAASGLGMRPPSALDAQRPGEDCADIATHSHQASHTAGCRCAGVYGHRPMRAGIFVAYWPWFSLEEQVALAVLADGLGLDSVWVSEAWGQDVVSVLALLAARTERIALGSGLMQIPARQPTAAAMAAASLDVISNGRFRLGLGVSGPQVSEGWYGVPFRRPLRRTREYVEIVRTALGRRTVRHAGEEWTLPLPDGPGRPLKLLARPIQERIPIYLGSIGPRAVEQTGEIADGWLPFMFDPSAPEPLLDGLDRGLAKAGRGRADIDVAPCVPFAVAPDVDAARDAVRPWLAFYLGAMGSREKNFYVEAATAGGHGPAARACQAAWLEGDRDAAAAALTPGLIDATAVATTPAGLDDRLAAFERAGVDTLVAVPCGADRPGAVRALAAAVGGVRA